MWKDRKWMVLVGASLATAGLVGAVAMAVAPSRTTAVIIALVALVIVVIWVAAYTRLMSWESWNKDLSQSLRGEPEHPRFLPIARELREYMERVAAEREQDAHLGTWTPSRLKSTLTRLFEGERIILLANREPYIHQRGADGSVSVLHPASGLVTALEPVMRACSGVWVAHGGGNADRESSDSEGRVAVPPGAPAYTLKRVWLTPEEERGYYFGLSNEGLWPLCHIADTRPTFRSEDWQHYKDVNRAFAEAAVAEADREDPVILVQDYHFALAPRLIRTLLPQATVITFWHIPWPNSERVGICPWTEAIIDGLLGSSILGFHTAQHCSNFFDTVDRYLEARVDRAESAVFYRQRSTLIRPYPISIEWPPRLGEVTPPAEECHRSVAEEIGLPADGLIGLGVDRLDYTKGIEERLLSIERLLDRAPKLVGRFSFVQIAAPSRTDIDKYRDLGDRVAALVQRINSRLAAGAWKPIHYLRAHHEPEAIFRYYRAANVCYVSSLHDGMNLVAKEFIAARSDEQGVLVLSQFAGAAKELLDALVVNPYDIAESSAALAEALAMPKEQQRERMRALRSQVAKFNVYRWAGQMLVDASSVRENIRRSGRRQLEADATPGGGRS